MGYQDRNRSESPQPRMIGIRRPANWLIVLLDCSDIKVTIDNILQSARQIPEVRTYSIPLPEYEYLNGIMGRIGNKDRLTDNDIVGEIEDIILEPIRKRHYRMSKDARVAVLFESDRCIQFRAFNLMRSSLSLFNPICSNPIHSLDKPNECQLLSCSRCLKSEACHHSCIPRLAHLLLEKPYGFTPEIDKLLMLHMPKIQ